MRTWEVNNAGVLAGDLFRRSFHHEIPDYPRHFVLVYSPPAGAATAPEVVAYVHQSPHGEVHLAGGLCVDERAYRRIPRSLFEQVRDQGGLSTIIMRDSAAMIGTSVASFAHVGEPRSRAALLRAGFADAGPPHLMATWLRPVSDEQKTQLVDQVAALGPF